MSKIKVYHGTNPENLASILKNGIEARFGEVYLTDSIESAVRWKIPYLVATANTQVLVIECEIEESELSEGCDHSQAMVDMFKVGKSITIDRPVKRGEIIDYYLMEVLVNSEVK